MTEVVMNGPDGARLILVKGTTRLIMAAARAPAHEAARPRSGPNVSVEGDVQLARWKCQGEDAPVENRGEHELKGVPDHWRLYRVMS